MGLRSLPVTYLGRRKWQSTPVFLPGESHGRRSLVGYISPWGRKKSDTTEWLHFQTIVEVVKITVISFKRSHTCAATLSAPSPAAGHCRPMPPPEIPRHSWASLGQSLLWSLLLSPGSWYTQGSVCALQESISQSCVSSGSSLVGLMMTSSKRAYATPRSAAPRAPAPVAGHCWPGPPQEMLKHSSVSVSVGSLCPGTHKVCLSPLSLSDKHWVWFAGASPSFLDVGYPLTVAQALRRCRSITYCLAGASLPLDVGYLLRATPVPYTPIKMLKKNLYWSIPIKFVWNIKKKLVQELIKKYYFLIHVPDKSQYNILKWIKTLGKKKKKPVPKCTVYGPFPWASKSDLYWKQSALAIVDYKWF